MYSVPIRYPVMICWMYYKCWNLCVCQLTSPVPLITLSVLNCYSPNFQGFILMKNALNNQLGMLGDMFLWLVANLKQGGHLLHKSGTPPKQISRECISEDPEGDCWNWNYSKATSILKTNVHFLVIHEIWWKSKVFLQILKISPSSVS